MRTVSVGQVNARARFAQQYMETLCRTLGGLPIERIAQLIELLEQAFREQRWIFLAGNGGSAATASHMATDFSKTVGDPETAQPGFRALALTDNASLLSAWANDRGFENVFVGQLQPLARPGDLLMVLSGSGQSPNVLRAVEWAHQHGLVTVGLLGRDGGRLGQLVDLAIVVPAEEYGPIEDAHLAINHLLTSYFKAWVKQPS